MSDEETSFNSKPLDDLIKILKSQGVTAKIGILGDKNSRPSDVKGSNSNAAIGAAHEFGSTKLPQRSFLRMPIAEKLPAKIEESGGLNEDILKQTIKAGNFGQWTKQMAILAVSTVLEAFDTEGWGKWAPLNEQYKKWKQSYSKKGNTSATQILTLTGQLRDSIDYEIKKS